MRERFIERRRYPRIKEKLPLKVFLDRYDISTETINLSCIGAYCKIDRDIPNLSKVSVALLLPKESGEYVEVRCRGVVVRKDKDPSGGCNVAIFFNDIKETEKNKILKYVIEKYGSNQKKPTC